MYLAQLKVSLTIPLYRESDPIAVVAAPLDCNPNSLQVFFSLTLVELSLGLL